MVLTGVSLLFRTICVELEHLWYRRATVGAGVLPPFLASPRDDVNVCHSLPCLQVMCMLAVHVRSAKYVQHLYKPVAGSLDFLEEVAG